MRRTPCLAATLSLALAACSSGEEADSGEALTSDEVAARIDQAPQVEPGEYETRVTLLEFEIPGLPDRQAEMVRDNMSREFARENRFCLTPEEAEEGPRRMVQLMAKSDCTFGRYDVSGGSLDAEMSCKGEGGLQGTVAVKGSVEGDASSMVMESTNKLPGMPGEGARMKMQIDSRRIGDCEA